MRTNDSEISIQLTDSYSKYYEYLWKIKKKDKNNSLLISGGYIEEKNLRVLRPDLTETYALNTSECLVHLKWSRGLFGPYFFEIDTDLSITVNRNTYRTLINNFCVPAFHGVDVNNIWFQRDGRTCHTSQQHQKFMKV